MTAQKFDEFINDLEKVLGPLPDNLNAYVLEGDKYDAQGDYEKAGAIYNHASKAAPSEHPVHKKKQDNIEKTSK